MDAGHGGIKSNAPEVPPNIREVWGLVRARTKEELRRIAVALVPPDPPEVRAYFADGSQRDYRYVGGLLEDVPAGFTSWPPSPDTTTPAKKPGTCEVARVYEFKVPLVTG